MGFSVFSSLPKLRLFCLHYSGPPPPGGEHSSNWVSGLQGELEPFPPALGRWWRAVETTALFSRTVSIAASSSFHGSPRRHVKRTAKIPSDTCTVGGFPPARSQFIERGSESFPVELRLLHGSSTSAQRKSEPSLRKEKFPPDFLLPAPPSAHYPAQALTLSLK